MLNFAFTKLLRRTTVALAAVAGFTVAGHVAAQTIILQGSTTNNCSFSTMTVSPAGNVSVNCSGQAQGGPGSFSVANAPAALAWNTTGAWNIVRSGGTTGAADVGYSIDGGCGPLPLAGTVHFDDGGATSVAMSLRTPNNDTTCIVRVTSASVGTIGTPSANVVVNVSGTAPSGGGGGGGGGGSTPTSFPVTANCPAQPLDLKPFSIEYTGVGEMILSGSQIATSTLPNLGVAEQTVRGLRAVLTSAQVILALGPASPTSSVVEISINRCPGVIDTTVGTCYRRMVTPQIAGLTWVDRPTTAFPDKGSAAAYNLCPAYFNDGTGPYYVNVRYNYTPSDCTNVYGGGGTACSYKQSYNNGGY